MKLSKREERRLISKGYDIDFLKRTQPKGHIDFRFDDRFWRSGDGIHNVLFVDKYPTTGLGDHWGVSLMEIENAISFMTLTHLDNREVQKQASKAAEEKLTRISDNAKMSKNNAEQEEINNLLALERNIRTRNTGVKGAWIRIFDSANTENELFKHNKDIKDSITEFSLTSFIGEQEFEFHAPFVPGSKQRFLPNSREHQPIPIRDLAGGYWFNHTKLEDSRGAYYGYTSTSGAVNYNFLQVTSDRTRPFMMIAGNPRMGQKRFFLKHTDIMFAKGMKIINIDIDGTFKELTERHGGRTIDASGYKNRINPMQTFPTATHENGIEVNEEQSFQKQVSKLKTFAQILNDDMTSDDLMRLEEVIVDFYENEGLYKSNAKKIGEENHITKLNNDEHPLISDFATFLKGKYRSSKKETTLDQLSLNRISKTFETLMANHSDKFDSITEFEDLSNEQVITFDFSTLRDDPIMLNLQLTQYLTLISSYVINNGKIQKKLQRGNGLERDQHTHYIINISSADTMFDPRYSQSVSFLAEIVESMANNFGAVVMEMTNIQSVLMASDLTSLDPYVLAVRRIFSLTQHRVLANLSESTIRLFAQTMGDSMTESELQSLANLSYGQLFLNIAGSGNVIFNQEFVGIEEERYDYMD